MRKVAHGEDAKPVQFWAVAFRDPHRLQGMGRRNATTPSGGTLTKPSGFAALEATLATNWSVRYRPNM